MICIRYAVLTVIAGFAFLYHSYAAETYNLSVGWTVVKSNNDELVISYKPVINGFDKFVTENGTETYLPRIENTYRGKDNPGSPASLVSKELLTVPAKDGFYVNYIDVKRISKFGKILAPLPSYRKAGEFYDPVCNIDNEAYSQNYINDWVEVKYEGISRNRHIASVNIKSAVYNGITRQIEIPDEIIISIKFKNYTPSHTKDDFSTSFTLNHKQGGNWLIDNRNNMLEKGTDRILSESIYPWLKINIEDEGLYKLDASYLSSNGMSVPREQVGTIKVFGGNGMELSEEYSDAAKNSMKEIPVIVKTNGAGDLESVIFYGKPGYGFKYVYNKGFFHYINSYSRISSDRKKEFNHYFITYGGTPGKRLSPVEPPEGEVAQKPDKYYEMLYYEEENVNAFLGGSGRTWFGSGLFPRTFSDNILNGLYTSDRIHYRFGLAHRAESTGVFSIYESGNLIKKITIPGTSSDAARRQDTASIAGTAISKDLRSVLKFEYTNININSATPYFDWLEIRYPRYLEPLNNDLGFFSDPELQGNTEYSINGFSGDILGLNVTNASEPVMLKNLSIVGNMYVFRTKLERYNPGRYFVSANYRKPSVEKVSIRGLRNETKGCELIIITPRDFAKSATKFKEYRTGRDGISADIFYTDEINNEFGSGIADPTAIRDFISYAFYNWEIKPKYVLLWGDGHYDYKNISTKKPNYIVTYQSTNNSETFEATYSFTSDDYFVQVAGDDVFIDLAIGRITVESDDEGNWMAEKIKIYENESSNDQWRTIATLMADDAPQGARLNTIDADSHTNQSEMISNNILPGYLQQKKVYLAEYARVNTPAGVRKPGANNDFMNIVNTSGTMLLSWIGHGNPRVWAHEELLERSNSIPRMTNLKKLFFATAATCDFGRFDMTDIKSGAEELVQSRVGGAIGIFSASRLVFSTPNYQILKDFVGKLYQPDETTMEYPRLGDVFYAVKQKTNDQENDAKYFILGDPTMRLVVPYYNIVVDSINGKYAGNPQDTVHLKALEEVIIKCRVVNPKDGNTIGDFNGTALVSMLDSDEEIIAQDVDEAKTKHHFSKQGSILNKSSYIVTNGSFTADFVIPKDISYSSKTGRLFCYAFSGNNRYAKGNNNNFDVKDILPGNISDKTGPEINIYLDSRDFTTGSVVNPTPLLLVDLYDFTGINTTGRGVGHRIEAWIDDSPESVDLTGMFNTSLTDSRRGTVETFLFDLEPGLHKIKIRAWDVYNNYSIAVTEFRIVDNKIIITDFYNYPNPVEGPREINFRFVHNLTPPFNAELEIYNVNGQLIYNTSGRLNTIHTGELSWNCVDNFNNFLPSGAYICQLKLISDKGISGLKTSMINYIE